MLSIIERKYVTLAIFVCNMILGLVNAEIFAAVGVHKALHFDWTWFDVSELPCVCVARLQKTMFIHFLVICEAPLLVECQKIPRKPAL